ncbi:MAG: adenine-specific DNA methylase [Betaproteobacteria bacterium RIFCSPLOWO2_12_FULL_62_58]|nr:MAG: adenine-specific DNA methylase [Betaproteobacteria bacterium RIFCSPLOWO2_12_FULL_62_58]
MPTYPKRLIEVDLPIRRISVHARREKSIRHGHISTLHIWWARRPLAACRAVICAALWPDPVDVTEKDVQAAKKQGRDIQLNTCPPAFRETARKQMLAWAPHERQMLLSAESRPRFEAARKNPRHFDKPTELRAALLDFIADFANWDNSTVREYLDTSRALTQAAHEALGGAPGTRPLVVDPFAGGGSIPLEALRVGADAFASDLNPVPVLLNKVVLEYIPKYGQRLADEVRKWGEWIKREAEKELAKFYPKDADGATPIAYLWARTIQCEGPGCGAEVPLIRSLWLAKKANRSVALQLVPNPKAKRVDFQIIVKQRDGWVDQANPQTKIENPKFDGTVKRGSATCPCCGYTMPVARVREQIKSRRGGANDARLLCVVTTRVGEQGRNYRLPTEADSRAVKKAGGELKRQKDAHKGPLSFVPDEKLDLRGIRHTWAMIYGISEWGDCFTARQTLALGTFVRLVRQLEAQIGTKVDAAFLSAIQTVLALAVGRLADYSSSLCRWVAAGEFIGNTFGRQALPMMWDFCEVFPGSDSTGGFPGACDWIVAVLNREVSSSLHGGHAQVASATAHPLPDDSANAIVTDPPYYDAVAYAFLSDFFYVWLRRNLVNVHPDLFKGEVVPKDSEIVVDRPHELSNSTHDIAYYERELAKAFAEGRRVVRPDGVGTIVFASKTTASWEAILKAVVDAGWIITGSWPIDTEMETRIAAAGQARLASSVHLVCRPRENSDGSARTDLPGRQAGEIGDWRDVLQELPRRIHEWMPRLAEEGIVGADAIFACLGPALEIFSCYSRVEKASGDPVILKEYLEQVWAAVAKEALTMIFTGADATGFEADARLTAMWLWTLNAGASPSPPAPLPGGEGSDGEGENGDDEEDEGAEKKTKKAKGGFVLEYDAARKIAQGLGAHLEDLDHIVEVKGDTARLLTVSERTRYLFGKEQAETPVAKRKKKAPQMDLFAELTQPDEGEAAWGEKTVQRLGDTTLDRVHQAMILFAAGRGEALRRFLVDDGAGTIAGFWNLAQSLAALYPQGVSERRWVEGVLARKKGLGL